MTYFPEARKLRIKELEAKRLEIQREMSKLHPLTTLSGLREQFVAIDEEIKQLQMTRRRNGTA
jgi:hypothetical protein